MGSVAYAYAYVAPMDGVGFFYSDLEVFAVLIQIQETMTNLFGLAEEGTDNTLEFIGDPQDGDSANLVVRCGWVVVLIS